MNSKRKRIPPTCDVKPLVQQRLHDLAEKFLVPFLKQLCREDALKLLAAASDTEFMLEICRLAMAEERALLEGERQIEELVSVKVQGLTEDEFRHQLADVKAVETVASQAVKPSRKRARSQGLVARHLLLHPELAAKASAHDLDALKDFIAREKSKKFYKRDRHIYRLLKIGAKRCQFELEQVKLGMAQIAHEALKGPLEKLREALPPEFPGSKKP